MTERVSAEEKLAHNALHDALTDLPNRRLFLDRLQRCHAQVRRDPGYHCAVMLADIDGFKALNHSLGSSAGDQLLIEIGLRLQSSLREGHEGARPLSSAGEFLLARFGGDEFAFLLEGCADENDVLRLAERAQAAVAAPLLLQQKLVRCTIGIGSAISSNSHTRPDDTLRDAETALRRAQAMGTGRAELFDAAMHNRAVHRAEARERIADGAQPQSVPRSLSANIQNRSATSGCFRGPVALATSGARAHRTQRISGCGRRNGLDGHDRSVGDPRSLWLDSRLASRERRQTGARGHQSFGAALCQPAID